MLTINNETYSVAWLLVLIVPWLAGCWWLIDRAARAITQAITGLLARAMPQYFGECGNCGCRMPEGCSGNFLNDGPSCMLNRHRSADNDHSRAQG